MKWKLVSLAIILTLGLLPLASASHVSAYSYGNSYSHTYNYRPSTGYSHYGFTASMPRFNSWEERPQGYGLVRQSRTPFSYRTRYCENNAFLGHTHPYQRGYYSYSSGHYRYQNYYRSAGDNCYKQTYYDPNSYWWA